MDLHFFKGLLDSLSDGVYCMDQDNKITYWNKAAERLSGYTAKQVIGKSCSENLLCHVDDKGSALCMGRCPLAATLQDGKSREANVYLHHQFGHRVPVFVRSSPIRDFMGNIIGAVEVFSENGEHLDIIKEIEGLRKEVLTDPLTTIGNRRYADISFERLDRAMAESQVAFGALFVDIDHFKVVNDTWSHNVGDKVIAMVGKTLSGILRPLDVACRWGGEEFVVLLSNTTEEGLAIIAERLRILVENSWVMHNGEKIAVTVSVGAALSAKGEAAASVVDRADEQVYLSKKAERNCSHLNGVKLTTPHSE